jgi:hypothetical protein
MDRMQDYATDLFKAEEEKPQISLQHRYPRMWDDWGRDKDEVEPPSVYFEEKEFPVQEESSQVRFRALAPDFIERFGMSNEPRLANEFEARIYGPEEHVASVFPSSAGTNVLRVVSEFGGFSDEWRIGKTGVVKLLEWNSPVHWTVPLGQDVFFAWLRDLGWTPEASPAGLIAKQMFKQLNGWVAWLNENALKFLEHMSFGKRASRGADVNEIRTRLVTSDATYSKVLPGDHLFTELLRRKVFVIGYETQCPRCFKHYWYSVKQLDSTLTCAHCLNEYGADEHIRKGRWTYKTAGPFSIGGYADGAYCVLASLNFFSDRLHHLALTPAMSFKATSASGKKLEADFGGLWRESNILGVSEGVLIGECKSFGEFDKTDIDRMQTLANDFPGAVLVFATFRNTLETNEKREITKIAKRGRKYWKHERPANPVCVLTGHELFSHFGPPYCWKHLGLEEKYSRAIGLMNFCDSTQQIHLGLPSRHDDWHKAWERRRARRVGKNSPSTTHMPTVS